MSDVLGFVTYLHHETGERRWGCRGHGPRYDTFYHWLNEQSKNGNLTEEQTDDWPWHYWGFNDTSLDDYMWREYKDDIFEEE